MTQLSRSTSSTASRNRNARRIVLSGCVAVATLGALVCVSTGTAAAATGGDTIANVDVGSALTLTDLTPTFTLTGVAGSIPTADVTYTVTTNNLDGYTVSVSSATDALNPPVETPVNPDTIPIASLLANGDAMVTAPATLTVQTKTTRSALDGDAYTDTYSMTIPDVNSDTYTATLSYLVATTT
jgi:hypothetical protein